MKRKLVMLLAVSLLAVTAPALAADAAHHGRLQETMEEQCARECEMLVKNCALQVDSIQERISKIQAAIRKQGTNPQSLRDLKILNAKLEEAKEILAGLEKPGR